MSFRCMILVRSWYGVTEIGHDIGYEVGTKLERSYKNWYEVGTKLVDKRRCVLFKQEDMCSSSTTRRVFLFNRKTCLLVQQEDRSSC